MGNSDRWLERGDYIRMRNVTLSYTFPSKTLEKTPISSLRIYLQGQNLLTFTKFWGDPEVGLSSGETISFAKSYNMQLDQVELMHILAETYYLLGSFEQAYLTLKAANNVASQ